MTCDACLVDKTVTVAVRFTIAKIDSRTGKETRVAISRRLCCACGGREPEPEAAG